MSYLRLARTLVLHTRARARDARAAGRSQVGASAIEWAIISAIVVGIAIVLGGVIRGVVTDNQSVIEQGSNP